MEPTKRGERHLNHERIVMLTPTIKAWLSGTIVALMTIGYGWYQYRNRQIERLYAEAIGFPSEPEGVGQSEAAVKRLSAYGGQRTTAMVLDV
jgi:hypothetical protein